MATMMTIENHATIEHEEGDACPVHGREHRKTYNFGSTMTCVTEVCTFRGCGCAVAIQHDPIGINDAYVTYHNSYESAAGVGKLAAKMAAAKYR